MESREARNAESRNSIDKETKTSQNQEPKKCGHLEITLAANMDCAKSNNDVIPK